MLKSNISQGSDEGWGIKLKNTSYLSLHHIPYPN